MKPFDPEDLVPIDPANGSSPEFIPPGVRSGEPTAVASESMDPRSPSGQIVVSGDHEAMRTADAAVLNASRQHTRRAFVAGGIGAAAAYGFYHWLDYGPHRNTVPALVDRGYNFNADLSRAVLRDHALAPTYPLTRAETLRVNGNYGLKKELKLDSYRLQLVGVRDPYRFPSYVPDVAAWQYQYDETNKKQASAGASTKAQQQGTGEDKLQTGRQPRGLVEAGESRSTLRPGTPGLLLTLDDLTLRLPRHELVTQFKCIEGWSQIVHWAGVRMADFLELYPPALVNGQEPQYVYMETPDGDYYVGYDLHVCRHPQSLLVTEMMGAPLTQEHGAPLRVHMPTKYGYKQIKRIGLIAYTTAKPDDYWAKLGYDWYAGL